jgi:predicted RNase H-like nuclease
VSKLPRSRSIPDATANGRVLGVDACPAGWVGVVLPGPAALVAPTIGALVAAAGPVDVIGIDIPIGLPDSTERQADVLAQRELGGRASTVFRTPVRAALSAPDHAAAVREHRRLTGRGLSIQAYGLRHRILEVDAWLPRAPRVVEVHPELSFLAMGGRVEVPKKTWAGAERRRGLLAAAGIALSGELGLAGYAVGVDDLLDAAAVAWTARRVAAGTAICRPDPPELFSDGIPAAIWS